MAKQKPGSGTSRIVKMLVFAAVYYIACFCGILCLNIYLTGNRSLDYGPFVYFSLSITALILFLVPLLTIYKIMSEKRGLALARLLSSESGIIGITFRVLRYPFGATLALCLIPWLSAYSIARFFGGVTAADILRASFMLTAVGITVLCLGLYFSIRFRNAHSAAGYALLIVIIICTQPLWFAPVINATSNASFLIQSSLIINPFVGIASAIDFDIFRTSPLYEICPIGQRKFHYPFYGFVALFCVSASLVLFWRAAAGIRNISEP